MPKRAGKAGSATARGDALRRVDAFAEPIATGPFDSLLRKWMRARAGLKIQACIVAKGVGRE